MDVLLNHVALSCSDREKALVFFTKILGVPRVKSFVLSKELSSCIFGIDKGVEVDVYDNVRMCFEVFNSRNTSNMGYQHVCIEVVDREDFIFCCKKYGLDPFVIKKDGKDLLFVRDFSGNLYEVKEQLQKKL